MQNVADRGGRAVVRGSLVALAVCVLASSVPAGDPPFVYSLNETGRLNLKLSPLEMLPTKGAQFRFTDLAARGGDRRALRVDGQVFLNGQRELELPFAPVNPGPAGVVVTSAGVSTVVNPADVVTALDRAAWIRMELHGGSVYALSAGGIVTRGGNTIAMLPTVDPIPAPAGNQLASTPGLGNATPMPEALFVDLLITPFGVFALRLDGGLFDVELGTKVGDFEAGPGVTGQADGSSGDTMWVRVTYDPTSLDLVALRADGRIVRVDVFDVPSGPAADGSVPRLGVDLGMPEAMLPATPVTIVQRTNLYVDLEIADNGDWYALRRDGAVFRPGSLVKAFLQPVGAAFFAGHPFTSPFLGPDSTGNPFVDLVLYGGEAWRVRSLGQLFVMETFLDALLNQRFVRLAVDDVEPDLSGVRNQRPRVVVYKTRVVEGQDIVVPVIALDIDQPSDELKIALDLTGLPGATFDFTAGSVVLPGGMPPGSSSFKVSVADGGPQKPVRQRLKVKSLAADTDPGRNTPPVPTRLAKVRALVGVELVLPIMAADRDGDVLSITPDGKGAFTRGATYDAMTKVLRWTPTCLDVGRRQAVFKVSDGQVVRRLRVRIEVLFPLFWDTEE